VTTPPLEAATPSGGAFGALQKAQYISLTTFRRNGEGVTTPVWFALRDGVLYIHTLGGKVKRIRHTPRVTVAPCTLNGRIIGPTIAARARIVTDAVEAARAKAALNAKYGLVRRLYYLAGRLRGLLRRKPVQENNVYVAIAPAD
jgi:PPOX class probable F420-dependent enzyme